MSVFYVLHTNRARLHLPDGKEQFCSYQQKTEQTSLKAALCVRFCNILKHFHSKML